MSNESIDELVKKAADIGRRVAEAEDGDNLYAMQQATSEMDELRDEYYGTDTWGKISEAYYNAYC